MLAGGIIARRDHPALTEGEPAPIRSGWLRLRLVIAAAALAAAQFIPLMETDSVLVNDRGYSVVGMARQLHANDQPIAALVVVAYLLVVPWLALAAQWLAVSKHRRPRFQGCADTLRHWVMLDVFALALVVFVVESKHAIATKLDLGAFILAGTVLVYGLALWSVRRSLLRRV